jgi:molybdopterin-guanine dinucleotide biosynthesis protein A
MTAWATRDTIRAMWADAPTDDTRLDQLLAAAQEEAEAYAPTLPVTDPPAPVPARYVEALALQCKEIWEAGQRSGDLIGGEDYPIRVRPLSDAVKQLLRPRNPRPRFGRPPVTP